MSNLVYLVYGLGFRLLEVVREAPAGVVVMQMRPGQSSTWTFEGTTYTVGARIQRVCAGSRQGIIGVFDSTNIQHLDCLANCSSIVTKQSLEYEGAPSGRAREIIRQRLENN